MRKRVTKYIILRYGNAKHCNKKKTMLNIYIITKPAIVKKCHLIPLINSRKYNIETVY